VVYNLVESCLDNHCDVVDVGLDNFGGAKVDFAGYNFLFHNASPDLKTELLLLVLTSWQRMLFPLIDDELLCELNARKVVS